MAFESLEPFRAEILQLRAPGPTQRSYAQIAEHLRQRFGVRTTAGTLCRYVKEIAPDRAGRTPDKGETAGIDTLMLFAELLAEIRGHGEEQRRAIEAQAGEIRILAETIAELHNAPPQQHPVPAPEHLRAIWLRALLVSTVLVTGVFAVLVLALRL
jgi:hypothetical protein